MASFLKRQGIESDSINITLSTVNRTICEKPLPEQEIQSISKSINKYEPLRLVKPRPEWKLPEPLPEVAKKVPHMSIELIPGTLRPWIEDICDRMQIPIEFIAAPAVVSLSTIIGRKIGIHPKKKDDWLVVPNLWGGVIARPGFFKSPAIAEALKPLEELVKKERIKYESALIVAKSKEDVIKAKLEGLKDNVKKAVKKGNNHEIESIQYQITEAMKELESINVHEKRYKTNDATVEKIGALLLENPDGIMIIRDELSGWLKTLDKSGREGDREFFLESWNGYGSFRVDRIGRGTLHIPSLCLSIFGGLQPGKLDAYIGQTLNSGVGDDGMIQRFQVLMYPELPKSWKNIDRHPNSKARDNVYNLYKKIANITSGGNSNQTALHFSNDAQILFNDWREKFERRLRSQDCETPAFESHLSKYRSLLPSLSLIFQLCDESKAHKEVGLDALELSLKWLILLEEHARKVYSSIIQSDITAARALGKKIIDGQIKDGSSVRSIYRKHWSSLDTPKQVDKALTVLEDLGWLSVQQVKINYRAKDEVRLNPNLETKDNA
ncbi:MAG: DUF3987 domain-containing protein [Oligoflexales bacterium]